MRALHAQVLLTEVDSTLAAVDVVAATLHGCDHLDLTAQELDIKYLVVHN